MKNRITKFILALALLITTACSESQRWEMVYPSGEVKEGTNKEDSPDNLGQPTELDPDFTGVFKIWHPNGQLYLEQEWKEGVPDGKTLFYHPNGRLMDDFEFSEGKRTGTWKGYTEEGIQYLEAEFSDGQNHGAFTSWHFADGSIRSKGEWFEGKKNGRFQEWDQEGNLILDEVWKNGQNKSAQDNPVTPPENPKTP
jgi:antitoxin component YwqK of YwqJK toxin-antitoxin module